MRATDVTLETLLLGKRPCGDGPFGMKSTNGSCAFAAGKENDEMGGKFDRCQHCPFLRTAGHGLWCGPRKGVHTLDEELDLSSLAPGLKQLASFILDI